MFGVQKTPYDILQEKFQQQVQNQQDHQFVDNLFDRVLKSPQQPAALQHSQFHDEDAAHHHLNLGGLTHKSQDADPLTQDYQQHIQEYYQEHAENHNSYELSNHGKEHGRSAARPLSSSQARPRKLRLKLNSIEITSNLQQSLGPFQDLERESPFNKFQTKTVIRNSAYYKLMKKPSAKETVDRYSVRSKRTFDIDFPLSSEVTERD